MEQIKQYLRYFDQNRFLFLFLADLAAKPEETLARVWRFLGVDPCPASAGVRVVNSAVEHYVRAHTTQKLRSIPGVSRLADAVPRRWREGAFRWFMRTRVYRWVARRHRPAPMLPQTREQLLARFREPNLELASFLKCDLTSWSE